MLAMTIAQVLGAVPITRLGRRFSPIPFLRVLIGLRTLALVGIAVLAGLHAPFPLVVAGAALAGLVNGAAYGNLRAVLNHLVPAGRLPRALGVAATLNEVTFVASPVLAAVLVGLAGATFDIESLEVTTGADTAFACASPSGCATTAAGGP